MPITVCIAARTIDCLRAGGHFWVYLNWALGLRDLGCDVYWLETVSSDSSAIRVREQEKKLRARLARYGLGDCLALCSKSGTPLDREVRASCVSEETIVTADLLLNLAYGLPASLVRRFRRSALVDIDPGLSQIWIEGNYIALADHDVYFTIGETVGRPEARFPDCGIEWQYTPPCIALDWWPVRTAPPTAPFTTVSSWYQDEWVEDSEGWYINDKRSGFLPYLNLPKLTKQPLELALCIQEDDSEGWQELPKRGWHVRDAWKSTATPEDYRIYIQKSRGEFSCVKPSCVRLQNAWISDRTLCFLASGKPAVVEHTGQSRILPDRAGLLRFRNLEEAVDCLENAVHDYDLHCRFARQLVEEQFDSRKTLKSVLERALV